MIPNFTAIVVDHLTTDPGIGVPVFGQRLPENTSLPVVRVSTLSVTDTTYPASVAWKALMQMDCLAPRDVAGWALANDVQTALRSLPQQVGNTVISKVESAGVQFVDDQAFRPPVGRWIVSVMVTARETGGT